MPASPPYWRPVSISLLTAVLASGCATTTQPSAPAVIADASHTLELDAPQMIPVVRYGRYTLVELVPLAAQRDLLLQIIDVSIPEGRRATVGDGLRHVLQRSGYQLCETAHSIVELYSLPLPAAHMHLGPMSLRDALLTLAGPAWELHADDRTREIWFVRVSDNTISAPAPELPSSETVQTFPIAGGQP